MKGIDPPLWRREEKKSLLYSSEAWFLHCQIGKRARREVASSAGSSQKRILPDPQVQKDRSLESIVCAQFLARRMKTNGEAVL